MNPTVKNSVVEPFDVVGAVTVEFSVLTQAIVWAAAEKSSILTTVIWPSTAEAVAIVIVGIQVQGALRPA